MLFSPRAFRPLLASLAVAAFVTWLAAWHPFSAAQPEEPAWLRLETAKATAGMIAVGIDEGHGYAIDRPPDFRAPFTGPSIAAKLPPGRIREMRIDIEGAGELALGVVSIQAGARTLARPSLGALHPVDGTTSEMADKRLFLRPGTPGRDVSFTVRFEPPLIIPTGDEPWLLELAGIFIGAFAVTWLVLHKWPILPSRWPLAGWPKLTIAALACASALLSAYPVVFLGKSFVSPNTIAYLLYLGEPTIPGVVQERLEYGAGSDLGATMWQTLPYSVIESRALWHDHEFPLWNRYNSGGLSLLGQGLSMLGDPLHFIPLLAGGAWWAWDIKFVLAKILFAIGSGLCAWSVTRRLGPSALIGISAAWIGFFAYRFNHPAFFSVCYAPWLLLPWLSMREAEGRRARWLCAAGLLAANWCELTSGTAKEASMLLLSLNATGLLALLLMKDRWRRIAPMLWANILFLLLSAPAWLLFVDALRHSITIYDAPRAYQLQPGLLIAFYDSIFSQDFTQQENITHPSLNFLVLIGVLWALWEGRGQRALLAGTAVAAALVFGVLPPSWLEKLPLIGQIEHIYNVFGCVLAILLLPVAAQGLAGCLGQGDDREWRATWMKVVLSIGGLLIIYLGFIQARPVSPFMSYRIEPPLHSVFASWYIPCLLLAAMALPWALRWARQQRMAGGALLAVCLAVLHFRSGMFVETKFDDYVMNPRTGVELAARSPAVEAVRAALQEPARVCGFNATLSPGYQALLGLEGIAGPDALHNPWYAELCTAAGLHTAWGWRLMVDEQSLPTLKRVYDALNLRFYLRESEGPTPSLPGMALAGKGDMDIYESKEVWPRAFFTDQCATYRQPQDFAQMLAQGDGRPFAAVQSDPALSLTLTAPNRNVAPARKYRLSNNSTEFVVHASGPGIVVLTETFEEGNFEVTVDGAPAQCLRVNHAFKGVAVDRAGDLRIRFTYWPRLLRPALWLSLGGLLLSFGTAVVLWRRKAEALIPAASPALGVYPCET